MTSLVLGAGGFIGLNLVDALASRGLPFRCGSRRRAPRIALRRRGVDIVHADLDRPESLGAAMRGVDVVYHAAGHYPALSLDRTATLSRGHRQLQAVLDAAAAAGVSRLVYVSSTATVAPAPAGASTEAHMFDQPPGAGVYHDLKWAMEQQALHEDRVAVHVACPGACLGPWDQRVGTSAPLVALAQGARPALPDGILNLVDVRDAAEGVVLLGTMPRPPRRVLLVGHDLRLLPFLRQVAERYGVPGPIPLEAASARELADADERRCRERGGRPQLSRELVDLIVHSVPIDALLSRAVLGVAYRAVEDTLNGFEQWARARRILPRALETVS